MIPKLYNAQNKFGVTSNSISKGKYADINDSFTPLSEESKAKISASMNETYNEFKSRVIKNRKINDDKSISNGNKNKEIIRILYKQGLFKIKDSVIKIANKLGISKHTVYLHLRNFEK